MTMIYSDDIIPGAAPAAGTPPTDTATPPRSTTAGEQHDAIQRHLGRLGAADQKTMEGRQTDTAPTPETPPADQQQPQPGKGYTLAMPEGAEKWDQGAHQAFAAVAPQLGLSQGDSQKFVELYAAQTSSDWMRGAVTEESARRELRNDWGAKYEENLGYIDKAVKAKGEEFAAWLDASGEGNNPFVLRALAVIGRNPDAMNAAKARAQIEKTMNDKKHPYWRGDKLSVFEMSLLHHFATAKEATPAQTFATRLKQAFEQ